MPSVIFHSILFKTYSTYKNSVLILSPIFIGVSLLPVVKFPIHLTLVTAEIVLLLIIEITNWTLRLYGVSKLLSLIDLSPDRYLIGCKVFLNSNGLVGIFQTLITIKTVFFPILTLEKLYFVCLT